MPSGKLLLILLPAALFFVPQAAHAQPDLVVDSIVHLPPTPAPAQDITYTVTFRNAGTVDAGGFWVRLFDFDVSPESVCPGAGAELASIFAAPLPAGDSATRDLVQAGGFATAGTRTVWIKADSTCSIPESDDGNNARTDIVTVGSPAVPPQVDSVTANPSSPNELQTITISAAASDGDGNMSGMTLRALRRDTNVSVLNSSCTIGGPPPNCSGNGSNATFLDTIGPFPANIVIEYWATAIDASGNTDEFLPHRTVTITPVGGSEPTLEDLSHTPSPVGEGVQVTYRARFFDPDGIDQIIMQEIIDGTPQPTVTCSVANGRISGGTRETCSFTGGGYPANTVIEYRALAEDRLGNTTGAWFSNSFIVGSALPTAVAPIRFPNPLGGTTFTELINRIIDFLFTIAVIVAPILLVIAGVVFMTAAGDPSRVATARRMLLWTIVGFGIILISKGLVEVLEAILGI